MWRTFTYKCDIIWTEMELLNQTFVLHNLGQTFMLCYLKQPLQVGAAPVWSQSVWILHPALRQVLTAPPPPLHVLFSMFTQTAYCTRPLHIHIHTQTHTTLLLCVRVSHAVPLVRKTGLCLAACSVTHTWLQCQGSSGWPSLSSRLLLQSAGMKSGAIEKGVNVGLSTLFSLLSAERRKELEARKMNHRQTDRERIISNHIRDYLCAWFSFCKYMKSFKRSEMTYSLFWRREQQGGIKLWIKRIKKSR